MKNLTPIMAIVWLSACAGTDPSAQPTAEEIHEVATVSGALSRSPTSEDPADANAVDKLVNDKAPTTQLSEWQLRESLSRSSSGIKPEKRPDGTSQVSLKGRFMSVSVVNRDSAGQRQQTCIDTPEAADRIFGAKR